MTHKSVLMWIFLCCAFALLSSAAVLKDQKIITAESGQTVTLLCHTPNNSIPILVIEWSRADLESEYILLYRDEQFDPEEQHPSFKNRVDLQDREMKDGDVSLILRDVTTNDTGTYECCVLQRRPNHVKRSNLGGDPICTINLTVAPPGPTGGTTEDGGKEVGSVGVKVGVSVSAVLLVAAVVLLIYRKHPKIWGSYHLPA